MTKEIITSNEELIELVKSGNFFGFCVAYALNKGHRDTIKEKKDVEFSVGDYDVKFDHAQMCFVLTNRIFFARIITAHFDGVYFIGDDENEVINELLTELQKEILVS